MRRDVRGVHLARNERSPCPESVFTIPEQAFTFARNQCSAWAGIRILRAVEAEGGRLVNGCYRAPESVFRGTGVH